MPWKLRDNFFKNQIHSIPETWQNLVFKNSLMLMFMELVLEAQDTGHRHQYSVPGGVKENPN